MDKSQEPEISKVFDFSAFRKRQGDSLLKDRAVDKAPKEFREFPYKNEKEEVIEGLSNGELKDDIIGALLNEFSEELENSEAHNEDKSLHFFELKNRPEIKGDEGLPELLEGISLRLSDLKDNCTRIKFLIDEIEDKISDN